MHRDLNKDETSFLIVEYKCFDHHFMIHISLGMYFGDIQNLHACRNFHRQWCTYMDIRVKGQIGWSSLQFTVLPRKVPLKISINIVLIANAQVLLLLGKYYFCKHLFGLLIPSTAHIDGRVLPATTYQNNGLPYVITTQRLQQIRGNFMYWFYDQGGNENIGDYQRDIHTSTPQIHKNFNFQLPFFGFRFNYTRVSLNTLQSSFWVTVYTGPKELMTLIILFATIILFYE